MRQWAKNTIAGTAATGTFLAGGWVGYASAESLHDKAPRGSLVCDKAEIVGNTRDQVTYLPVVRAVGKVSLGDVYTILYVGLSTTDSLTGNVINPDPEKPPTVESGIAAVTIPLEEQGNIAITVMISPQKPDAYYLPMDAPTADCRIQDVIVTN